MNSGLSRYQRSSPSRAANLLAPLCASEQVASATFACLYAASGKYQDSNAFVFATAQIFNCRFGSFLSCRAAKACSLNEENRRRDQSSTVSVKMNKIGKIYGTELWVEF